MNQSEKRYVGRSIAFIIRRLVRALTGARSLWVGCQPEFKQRIYYANHNSHMDFILLWASLPQNIRRQTRPVAASDYWNKTALRRFIIRDVFNGITIARERKEGADPLISIKEVLENQESIIFFPEGTRNLDENQLLLPFKSGLFYLHQAFPEIEIIPVWIANLNRVMPKGAFLPLPLLSTVTFGQPLKVQVIKKNEFIEQARNKLLELNGEEYK
ncbi:lysophospholipid acyltransferase family protein [Acinetobacter baumannii]|jgi:1-acyl-sn-glycerol-3-phosphate acyltransferase|uniref:lysophospholipid acyltransferase family protein n=1 Tax=Acinetobacter TaxID=469 RepID=UPI00028DA30C|nr:MULTISPECIES: lysophospholipid acyltransferase family protein [Acinetobacter]EJB8538485.1 1-acyl-sn-glycerol-3-phosphate acyltransferase [Acinetobacter baumannii]EKK08616.1 acyltransferase [Acinetobacter baumannii Naval-72]EKV4526896.1 1-acyl-sn-glycerol-3-phosphate acyltransferase [Acinetobacter baumannii]MCT9417621.1 1-acyl-sn-glycerol-3-phosphate acyltransferase [Acinetobacter baumannii]MCW1488762.1 1-acyl-sn-glycerol-3-phosphate acyltransferase [Acinetobacter baumannii]